nr:hypothetical protein [Tanacetum cinerariifolium]
AFGFVSDYLLCSSMGHHSRVNRLTTDGIKDGIFKKKENARDKRRCSNQFKNQGMNDMNKRQRNARNLDITAPEKEQVRCYYYTRKIANERPRPTFYECGDPNHFRKNCLRLNRPTTSRGNHPNPVLAIEGKKNQRKNRNQARGRAFTIVAIEAL